MSAREDLVEEVKRSLDSGIFPPPWDAEIAAEKMVDDFAHELAEELRGFGMEDAGNFIDPEV